MEAVKPAPAAQTERAYEKLALRLLRSAERLVGRPWTEEPRAAIDVHALRRAELARSTWRQYRAALAWFFAHAGIPELCTYVRSLNQSVCLRRARRTSAQKSKHLPPRKLTRLIEVLGCGRGRYDRTVGLWLLANYYVGLRPEEWWSAELVESRRLRVRNAKASQNRTFGTHRTLLLDSFTDEEMQVILEFLAIVARSQRAALYEACRKRLLKINHEIWPRAKRHVTLYTGRHQFAADHKAARVSRIELAALMGHGSTLTAGRHYARAGAGRGRIRVRPSPEDVDRVRARNAPHAPAPEYQRRPQRR
jgi:hypothetical protein